jgi:hypothetical protein
VKLKARPFKSLIIMVLNEPNHSSQEVIRKQPNQYLQLLVQTPLDI